MDQRDFDLTKLGLLNSLQHNWPFIYFHGQAEEWADKHNSKGEKWEAPDLVSGEAPRDSFEDGVHDVDVYGKPAKLYIWTYGMGNFVTGIIPGKTGLEAFRTEKRPARHGLIVFAGTQDEEYAQEKLTEKASIL